MQPSDKKLKELKAILDEAEEKVAAAKRILFEQVYQEQAKNLNIENDDNQTEKIIEGIFDGEEMIDQAGKKYPVLENYASKSKLVAGDQLKLTVAKDGTFIFKQISPVNRKRIVGALVKNNSNWAVDVNGKKYNVLQASVTYFRAQPGDEITIIIPKSGECEWAAIENRLGENSQKKQKKSLK